MIDHNKFTQTAEALLFSEEFQELRNTLEFREPNIWRILGIAKKEIMVSSFLAWMLNPKTNHFLKTIFLKRFLIQTLNTEVGRHQELRPVNILVMDLSEAVVETEEWLGARRCDILIRDDKSGLLCIVENKITSKEGIEQTRDYYLHSFQRFPKEKYPHRIYVYLTPDGDPPICEQFIPLTYGDILACITDATASKELSEPEKYLLKQFQENIIRGIAMDKNTRDLAQAIYDQHADVIEFIIRTVERREEADEIPIQRSWDGKTWFFNIGENSGYRWEDCRNYGFICAGGAKRYRDLMERFEIDHEIYAYVSKSGYVGVARITKKAVPFRDATLADSSRLVDQPLIGEYNGSLDNDTCDWIALVNWVLAVDKSEAIRQDTITRLTTSRIYEHRKNIAKQVLAGLKQKSLSIRT
jgi:hypothetical protein